MKINHEEKRTPTFREWSSGTDCASGTRFEIVRIFCNSEWRTVTFVTDEFKLNIKHSDKKDFERQEREIRKLVTKHCRAFVTFLETNKCYIEIVPASDADESPAIFEPDDLGYVRK